MILDARGPSRVDVGVFLQGAKLTPRAGLRRGDEAAGVTPEAVTGGVPRGGSRVEREAECLCREGMEALGDLTGQLCGGFLCRRLFPRGVRAGIEEGHGSETRPSVVIEAGPEGQRHKEDQREPEISLAHSSIRREIPTTSPVT